MRAQRDARSKLHSRLLFLRKQHLPAPGPRRFPLRHQRGPALAGERAKAAAASARVGDGALSGTCGTGKQRRGRLRRRQVIVGWHVVLLQSASIGHSYRHAMVFSLWRCNSLVLHAFGLWFNGCCQAALGALRPEAAVQWLHVSRWSQVIHLVIHLFSPFACLVGALGDTMRHPVAGVP